MSWPDGCDDKSSDLLLSTAYPLSLNSQSRNGALSPCCYIWLSSTYFRSWLALAQSPWVAPYCSLTSRLRMTWYLLSVLIPSPRLPCCRCSLIPRPCAPSQRCLLHPECLSPGRLISPLPSRLSSRIHICDAVLTRLRT